MSENCAEPLGLEVLLAYRLGELEPAHSERVEEHYFSCAACSARLEALERLGQGVIEAVRSGLVSAAVTSRLLERGIREGLKVRSYRLRPGEQVACTAAPDDDFLALHLAVNVGPEAAVDVAVEWTELESGVANSRYLADVAVDRVANEVVLLSAGRQIREVPKSRWHMQAIVRGASGEQRFGPYTLNHTPWEQLEPEARQ